MLFNKQTDLLSNLTTTTTYCYQTMCDMFTTASISSKDQYGRDMALRNSSPINNQETLSSKDEFGRDVELRNAFRPAPKLAEDSIEDYINAISEKLKVMSWAEYDYEQEEINASDEEATEDIMNQCISKLKEERAKVCHQILGDIRGSLITMGLYELEEGEVLN